MDIKKKTGAEILTELVLARAETELALLAAMRHLTGPTIGTGHDFSGLAAALNAVTEARTRGGA